MCRFMCASSPPEVTEVCASLESQKFRFFFLSFFETSSGGDKRWRKTTPSTRDVCLQYLSLFRYEAQPVDPLDECSEMILTTEFEKSINRDLAVNTQTLRQNRHGATVTT